MSELSIFYYVKNIMTFFLISKNFFFEVNNMNKIIVRITINDLKDTTDIRIINSIQLLYELTGLFPEVCYVISGYNKGSRVVRFSCKVTLKKTVLFDFLDYFLLCCLNLKLGKRSICKYKYDFIGNVFFFIKDINLFRNLSDNLYLFKGKIFFELYFLKGSKKISFCFLNSVKF